MKMLRGFWILIIVIGYVDCRNYHRRKCLENMPEITPKRYLYIDDHTAEIKIEVTNRISHQLISHILEILLEEVVGYANVTIVQTTDYMNASYALDRIAGCTSPGCETQLETPESMVNLEVWMGPGFSMEKWIRTGDIEPCGPLGPVGRLGWFVPQSLIKEHLIKEHQIIDHWRALKDDHIIKMFDLSDDIDNIKAMTQHSNGNANYCNFKNCRKGLYYPKSCRNNATCAILLASVPEASNGMIRELIDNLDLRVKVAWIGDNLEHYVLGRLKAKKPVLFFNWRPNIITNTDDFSNIAFPRCEDIPTGVLFPSNCAFEINQLTKVMWSGLKAAGPEIFHVVRAISFSQRQYLELLDFYQDRGPGVLISDVACSWIKHNNKTWSKWIPNDLSSRTTVYLGGIFPLSGISYSSKGIIPAVEMALEAINSNQTLLEDYKLELLVEDGQCSADYVMRGFIKYVTSKEFPRMAGILGPACTDTVEPIAGVSKHFHAVIISYSAEGTIFTNSKDYPYFFRTISSNKNFKLVYLPLFQRLGWTRVASLTQDGMRYPEYLSLTQDYLQAHGINFIVNRKFPRERVSLNMSQYLEDLKQKNAKIIIGDFYDFTARAIFCEAFKQGMTARQGFIWFLPRWFSPDWYDTDFYNNHKDSSYLPVPCTTSEMLRAVDGYMSLGYAFYNDDDKIMQEGFTVNEWRRRYKERIESVKVAESEYAGYAYDAVWVFAMGLDKLLKQNHSFVATLHTERTARVFADYINQTDFMGVSGNVRFVGPSRVSVINIIQRIKNKTKIVGRYIPSTGNGGRLELNESDIVWLTPNGRIPDDGREVPGQCALESFRRLLNVNCEVAIVIVNIIGFGLFAVMMLLCFILFKRRYEKRVRITEERMKELGLMTANNMLALDQWEVARDCVVINRKIGEGAFGTVYGGEVFFDEQGWVPVAVKTLKIGSTVEEKLDFLSEAEMMKRFDHQNIVRLLGVCTRGEPVYTIMEFMLYGDLKTYLLARRHMVNEKNSDDKDDVSDRRLTLMALDIARGLSYLAEIKFVHRDLACRNCLINSYRVVKIGDFGMARMMYDSDYYRFNKKGMLPVRWMAPESLADGLFTPMSDIWSFGVLLFEVITFGSFPFQGLSNNQVLEYVKAGNTLATPKGCKPELEKLLKRCWVRDPHQRITANAVVELLVDHTRLLSPCLDVPLASVEIGGTDSLEIKIPERGGRRLSTSSKGGIPVVRRRSGQGDALIGSGECIPLCSLTDGNCPCLCSDKNCVQCRQCEIEKENNGCVLKTIPPSPSSAIHTRYVTLQHKEDPSTPNDNNGDICRDPWCNVVTSL